MMIDVDHFKKFNDTHGHLAGDEVLRGVARGLGYQLRDTDIVARYGGEEFAIIMAGTTLGESEIGAVRAAAHIADCRFEFEGRTLNVTVSGGLAQALPGEDEATLIKRADEALYAAKKVGPKPGLHSRRHGHASLDGCSKPQPSAAAPRPWPPPISETAAMFAEPAKPLRNPPRQDPMPTICFGRTCRPGYPIARRCARKCAAGLPNRIGTTRRSP